MKKKGKRKNRRSIKVFIACIALPILIYLSHCIEIGAAGHKKTGKNKTVVITGNNVKSRLIGKSGGRKIFALELTGNPRIETDTILLRTNKIIIHDSLKGIAECSGKVILINKKNGSIIRSKKALFYKDENRLELFGNPRIYLSKVKGNETVFLSAVKIEYLIDKEVAKAYEKVFVKKNDVRINSGRADYFKDQKKVIFFQKPVIRRNEDIYRADEIVYFPDDKCMHLNGNAHVVTYTEEKEEGTGKIKKVRNVSRGEQMIHRDGQEKSTLIKGKAVIEREDAVFMGNEIFIRGARAELVTGKDVHILYKKENVEAFGKEFNYNKKNKYASLWGNPLVYINNKNSGETETKIFGEYMEFYQQSDEILINGNVKINNEKESIKGDFARYSRKTKKLYVTGNSRLERRGAILFADSILYNIENNETRLVGNIRGNGLR